VKFASYATSGIVNLSGINLTHIGVEKLANGADNFKLNGETIV
jgi:hypothetical protein